jgi:hypothetical protein
MKKTVAGELLEEMLATSVRSFLTAQNKIPATYRDQEMNLGAQIMLWLWLRNRFNELEKKLEQEIKAFKPKDSPEWKIEDE